MIEPRVIRRQGRYTILADSQPLALRDGTVVELHRVQEQSHHEPCRFLRAVLNHPLIDSHIFDVRDLASCLDAEIRQLPRRDEADVVVLELRTFYPDGAGLLTKIVEESIVKLPPAGSNDGEISDAERDAIAAAVQHQGQLIKEHWTQVRARRAHAKGVAHA